MGWLGYSGLAPFYLSAAWVAVPAAPAREWAAQLFIVYGAVILAFLGGTLWGNAATWTAPAKSIRLVVSNLVALYAAIAALVDDAATGAMLLALGQILVLLWERRTARRTGWYLRLRTRLTLAVLPAHALFVFGISAWQ